MGSCSLGPRGWFVNERLAPATSRRSGASGTRYWLWLRAVLETSALALTETSTLMLALVAASTAGTMQATAFALSSAVPLAIASPDVTRLTAVVLSVSPRSAA